MLNPKEVEIIKSIVSLSDLCLQLWPDTKSYFQKQTAVTQILGGFSAKLKLKIH